MPPTCRLLAAISFHAPPTRPRPICPCFPRLGRFGQIRPTWIWHEFANSGRVWLNLGTISFDINERQRTLTNIQLIFADPVQIWQTPAQISQFRDNISQTRVNFGPDAGRSWPGIDKFRQGLTKRGQHRPNLGQLGQRPPTSSQLGPTSSQDRPELAKIKTKQCN